MTIDEYLERKKISAAELSRKSGVSETLISLLASGKRKNFTWATSEKLRDATCGLVVPPYYTKAKRSA